MTAEELEQWKTLRDPQTPPESKEASRQALLGSYLALVRIVVSRLALSFPSATVESSDLIQSGVIGLMDALERFDPAMGVEFRTYAQARIRGSVLDELRSLDWMPRSVREKARSLARATADLNHRLQRTPTAVEMAQALNLGMQAFHRLADEAQTRSVRSLEAMLELEGDSTPMPRSQATQEEHLEKRELAAALKEGLSELGERDRSLLALYYEQELTLKEIAQVLGVTESRVCQIHGALLLKLRAWLTGRLADEPAAPADPDPGMVRPHRNRAAA
jgi:RNA polymerase sigma factor for flagellar operon FliA